MTNKLIFLFIFFVLTSPALADEKMFAELMSSTAAGLDKKDFRRAEKDAKAALSEAKRTYGDFHPQTSRALQILHKVYKTKGDERNAQKVYEQLEDTMSELYSVRTRDFDMVWGYDRELPRTGKVVNFRLALRDDPAQYMVVASPGLEDYLMETRSQEVSVRIQAVFTRKTQKIRSFSVIQIGDYKTDKILTRMNLIRALQ